MWLSPDDMRRLLLLSVSCTAGRGGSEAGSGAWAPALLRWECSAVNQDNSTTAPGCKWFFSAGGRLFEIERAGSGGGRRKLSHGTRPPRPGEAYQDKHNEHVSRKGWIIFSVHKTGAGTDMKQRCIEGNRLIGRFSSRIEVGQGQRIYLLTEPRV